MFMDYDESELTRRCLLNSHSRGSLEEVAGEDDIVGASYGSSDGENEGPDATRLFMMQAYE